MSGPAVPGPTPGVVPGGAPGADEPPRSSAIGGVARGGAANVVGAGTSAVVGFVLTIVITRGLPQEVAGVFFTTTSAFLVIVALAQVGTNTGLVYFVSRARALDRAALVPAYVRTAAVPVLSWTLVLGASLVLAAPSLGALISPDQQDLATTSIRVLGFFLPFASLENLTVSATRGLGTMRPTALLTLITRPAVQLGLVWVTVQVAGPAWAVAAWGAGYVVTSVLGLVWWRRLLRRLAPGAGPAGPARHREFWSFTWPRAIMTVAQISMQRLDIVLVAALAGAAPAAVYAAATRFVVAGQMGSQAVTLAAQPRFAQQLAVDDHAGVRDLYRTSTAWLVLMTWPLYLVLAVFAVPVMGVFGREYRSGSGVIVLLAVALMVSSVLGMVEVVLAMAGRTLWTLTNTLIGLGCQVGLDIWLIPQHGVIGAAVGWSVAIVVRNVLALLQVRATLGLHPFGRATLTAVALTTCTVGAPLALSRLVGGSSLEALAWGSLVAVVSFSVGLVVLRRPMHIDELVGALRRPRRRVASG